MNATTAPRTAPRPTSDAPFPGELDPPTDMKVTVENLDLWYGKSQALHGITLRFGDREATALIGPSGSGKSTLLRCLNRMNELYPEVRVDGAVRLDGRDLQRTDPVLVRRRVGMVFQAPNPFPKSIYKNVAWGAKINGFQGDMDALVEQALRQAALWDEVKDRLSESATGLSGGQQQRLCIARALAVEPEVLLMDEPTSALDPRAAGQVEETIAELKTRYAVVIVTHNMQQAQRVSDRTAFLYDGALVEAGLTAQLFEEPQHARTRAYVRGAFG